MNPYQPSAPLNEVPPATFWSGVTPCDREVPCDVEFELGAKDLRYAESKYVLAANSARLTIASFAMITLSLLWIGWLASQGFFAVGWITAMLFSAAGYLAIVHPFKTELREQMSSIGLVAGTTCQLFFAKNELILSTANGRFRWPLENIRVSRTLRGLLFSLGRHRFLFVPKHSNFRDQSYKEFRARIFGEIFS